MLRRIQPYKTSSFKWITEHLHQPSPTWHFVFNFLSSLIIYEYHLIYKACRNSNAKTFSLSTFSLPTSLCFYSTVYETEVDTTNKKVGEYVNRTYFPYYGTNMISTEAPSSLTNTNLGSFILSDANNYVAYTGNSITFNSGQNMTICFWFKLTSVTGNGSVKISF